MASAGRILIMPKGEWSAETEYEMLDLVYHDGSSWLAKETSVGIVPSEADEEYWQRFSEESHKVAFKHMQVNCQPGNTDYSFDLSEFSNNTIIGSIHWICYPVDTWEYTYAEVYNKDFVNGVIRTDVANTFIIYCTVFYK